MNRARMMAVLIWEEGGLPRYLESNRGAVVENFQSSATWTQNAGTVANNTSEFRHGVQSIKLTSGSGVAAVMTKSVAIPSSQSPQFFRVSFYIHDTFSKYSYITISLAAPDWSNYWTYSKGFTVGSYKTGWNTIDIGPDLWTVGGGTPAWTNGTAAMQLSVLPQAGQVVSISWDQITTGYTMSKVALINFDDYKLGVYTQAFEYMRQKKARGTFYVQTDTVGSPNVTVDQLLEMDAEGWAIASHTNSHPDLAILTQEQVETELLLAKTTLDGWGLTKSSAHVAYPGGSSNLTVQAAMAAAGMLTGRNTDSARYPTAEADNNYLWGTKTVQNTDSLATVKGWVDACVTNNRICAILFHDIVDGTAGSYQWNTSDFCDLIDYIASLGFQFITVNDLYSSQSRRVPIYPGLVTTAAGAPWSVVADGSTTIINAGKEASINNIHDGAFTAEGWFKADGQGQSDLGRLFEKGSSSGWSVMFDAGGRIEAKVWAATTSAVASVAFSEYTAWHHWAITFDDAGDRKLRLWKDGALAGTSDAAVGAVVDDSAVNLAILNRPTGSRTYDGNAGWQRLSNVVRYSAAFVPPSRRTPPTSDANTLRLFKLNEGTGTAITDSSSHAVNATLTGGTWAQV